jgi:hypothetical protein
VKVKVEVNQCEIDKCTRQWLEGSEDDKAERRTCIVCGRDACAEHSDQIRINGIRKVVRFSACTECGPYLAEVADSDEMLQWLADQTYCLRRLREGVEDA